MNGLEEICNQSGSISLHLSWASILHSFFRNDTLLVHVYDDGEDRGAVAGYPHFNRSQGEKRLALGLGGQEVGKELKIGVL